MYLRCGNTNPLFGRCSLPITLCISMIQDVLKRAMFMRQRSQCKQTQVITYMSIGMLYNICISLYRRFLILKLLFRFEISLNLYGCYLTRLNSKFVTAVCITTKSDRIAIDRLNEGVHACFNATSRFVMTSTLIRLRRFSCVLPNTELFITL